MADFYKKYPPTSGGGGSGTVTSVGLADGSTSPIFSISGSPVTTSGTLTFTLLPEPANTVLAGPTSGGPAEPTFRALVAADIPALPYLSNALTNTHILVGNASNIATDVALSGDATLANTGALTLNTVNGNVGSFTLSNITVNAKGLITAASSTPTGDLTDVGTDGITITGGTGAVIGSGTSISQHVADATHNGYLSSTDWVRFDSTATGAVTTIGTYDSQPASADGLTIVGNSLYAQSATDTEPGMVNTIAQSFTGQKTFQNPPILVQAITPQTVAVVNAATELVSLGNWGYNIGSQFDNGMNIGQTVDPAPNPVTPGGYSVNNFFTNVQNTVDTSNQGVTAYNFTSQVTSAVPVGGQNLFNLNQDLNVDDTIQNSNALNLVQTLRSSASTTGFNTANIGFQLQDTATYESGNVLNLGGSYANTATTGRSTGGGIGGINLFMDVNSTFTTNSGINMLSLNGNVTGNPQYFSGVGSGININTGAAITNNINMYTSNVQMQTGTSAQGYVGYADFANIQSGATLSNFYSGMQVSPSLSGSNLTNMDFRGVQITPNITAQVKSAAGLQINLNNSLTTVTGRSKAIDFNNDGGQGITGSAAIQGIPNNGVDSAHTLNSQLTVPLGTPLINSAVFLTLAPGGFIIQDDFPGITFAPGIVLGGSMLGFVGQASVGSGKTMGKLSMTSVGFSVPPVAGDGGTITDMVMFDALGGLSAGGNISVTNAYGLLIGPGLSGLTPTNAWGISVKDTLADNFLSKSLAINTVSEKVTAGTTGLEILTKDFVLDGGDEYITSFSGANGAVTHDTSGKLLSVPVTTNGDILTVVAGAPAWATPASSGVTTIGTIDSQPASANGLVISGTTLYAQSASITDPGMVNNAAQSFSGSKTFIDPLIVNYTAPDDTDAVAATISVTENVTVTGSKTVVGVQGVASMTVQAGAVNDKTLAGLLYTVQRGDGTDQGNLHNATGMSSLLFHNTDAAGSTDEVVGVDSYIFTQGGTITNSYDFRSTTVPAGPGVITNAYGLYITAGPVTAKQSWIGDKTTIGGTSFSAPTAELDVNGSARIRALTTAGIVTTDASGNLSSTAVVAVSNGGTGVSSVTTTPTATAFAGWDADKNFSANNFIEGYDTTATAAGTTNFTVASAGDQYFTGATTQSVELPDATSLVIGHQFRIVNLSTGIVTVKDFTAATLRAMSTSSQVLATLLDNSTPDGVWDITYSLNSALTIGTIDTNGASANGLSISGTALFAQSASASNPGMVNNTTQTMSGAKTFSTSVQTPSAILSGSTSGTITQQAANTTTSYSVKWPNAQGAASTVLTNDGAGNLSWSASGSSNLAVTSKTANYTATNTDGVILCSGSAFTVTLFTAAGNTGKVLHISKTDASFANIITIAGAGAETIGSWGNTVTLNTQDESWEIVSDGTNWQVLEHRTVSQLISYSPSFNGIGSPTNVETYWKRNGNCIELQMKLTTGTVSAAEAQVGLPPGLTSASTGGGIASIRMVGIGTQDSAAVPFGYFVLIEPSVTYVTFGQRSALDAPLTKQNGNAIFGSAQIQIFTASLPIDGWIG